MFKNKEQMVYELAMQYVSKTFDFENESPEDLLITFQDVYGKISKSVESQNQDDSGFSMPLITGIPRR